MTAATMSAIGGRPRQIGKVFTTLTVANFGALVKRGLMPVGHRTRGARRYRGNYALPPGRALQAARRRHIDELLVGTATGTTTARIARGVLLTVEGRSRTVD